MHPTTEVKKEIPSYRRRARSGLRRIGKPFLRFLTPTLYRKRPIQKWPRWMAHLHDVCAPRAVEAQPELAPTGGPNIELIFRMIERTRLLDGELADCGVFRRASLIAIGIYLQQQQIAKTVYSFDSSKDLMKRSTMTLDYRVKRRNTNSWAVLAILLSNW